MQEPTNSQISSKPKDWLAGLKENFSKDFSAGFVVFLLALPLSLGIAKASEVPPLMGLVTAIIGGVLVSFFTGCKLSIKGPAAGLIVIIAGAVAAFGGGEQGWKLAAGAMVVAGICQILFGLLKYGKYVDFFPLAAIHGMLAAIGLIIIAKQIPVLLNIDPSTVQGLGPVQLLGNTPKYIQQMDGAVATIGGVSLLIMFFWRSVKNRFLALIPAPLVVLLFAIPAQLWLDFSVGKPSYTLLNVGSIIDTIGFNANFEGISQTGIFVKYVIMLALVGSLESSLTVKAIDIMDPFKRWSNPNQDLVAVGIGNTLAALLGGIPMISEVARSTANVQNGAQTRWSNFFHGLFLLIFAVAAYPLLEMIPNTALAAMLIAVGFKLAHPKEFIEAWRIGWDQLAILLVTIVVTLLEDLLVGIAAGILVKFLIHLYRGVSWKYLFRAPIEVEATKQKTVLTLHKAAVFSNYIGFKNKISSLPDGQIVEIRIADDVVLIDHSFMENLQHFVADYEQTGGKVMVVGLEGMTPFSEHPLAARRRTK